MKEFKTRVGRWYTIHPAVECVVTFPAHLTEEGIEIPETALVAPAGAQTPIVAVTDKIILSDDGACVIPFE